MGCLAPRPGGHPPAIADWKGFLNAVGRRHGVAHVNDGVPFGISAQMLVRRADREGWARPRRSIVVARHFPDSHEQRCHVAVRAIRGPVLIAGRSALYAARTIERPPPIVEVLVPHTRGVRSNHGVLVNRSRTTRFEKGVIYSGLACTSIERAIIEGGRRLPEDRYLNAFIDAERRGLISRESAYAVRRDLANARGVGRFDQHAARLSGQRIDSGMELESRDLFRAYGYEPWPEPFRYRCRDGVTIALDLAFPYEWIAYEVHGERYHDPGAAGWKDRKRWSEQTKDWSTGWIDRHRLDHDAAGIIADFRDRLASVEPNRPPAELPALTRPDLRPSGPLLTRTARTDLCA